MYQGAESVPTFGKANPWVGCWTLAMCMNRWCRLGPLVWVTVPGRHGIPKIYYKPGYVVTNS